jgi:methylamine dehydrogenase heavy chain
MTLIASAAVVLLASLTQGKSMSLRNLLGLLLIIALLPASHAQIPVEKAGLATLGDHTGQGWFWVGGNRAPSQIDGRFFLFDDQGKMRGQLNNGFWPNSILTSKQSAEIYVPETYFARGLRGERTDVVTVYDGKTLLPTREVRIPSKRINALGSVGLEALTDDERFMLVFNYTPAQSVSVVDLKANRFVGEIETPGCASIYPAGDRDFYVICGDGGFLHVRLNEAGQVALKERIAPLFDPIKDFINTTAARKGSTWYFLSRQNNVVAIEMTSSSAKLVGKWSLLSDSERKSDWRYSGVQHIAIHHASDRLYALMHKGEEKTSQEPGTEVWVYDLKTQKKIDTIKMDELTLSIAVSQSATPRLYSIDFIVPMPYLAMIWIYLTEGNDGIFRVMQQAVSIYDTVSHKRLQHVRGLPMGYLNTIVPW